MKDILEEIIAYKRIEVESPAFHARGFIAL